MPNILGTRKSRTIPLCLVFVLILVLPIVAVTAVIGAISYLNGQKTVDDLAARLSREISHRVEFMLDNHLGLAQKINEINADALRQGLLDPGDTEQMVRYFWQQAQRFRGLGTIAFAGKNGSFVGANEPEHYLVLAHPTLTNGAIRRYAPAPQGGLVGSVLTERPDYDARTRSWFKTAVKAGKPTWAGISSSVTGVRLDLTAVLAHHDGSGGLQGVFMLDIPLSQVSAFLRGMGIGGTGQVFIMERNGDIVASSFDERPYVILDGGGSEPQRLPATASKSALISAAASFLATQFPGPAAIPNRQRFTAVIGGARNFIEVIPYNGNGLDFHLVIVLPEVDFMKHVRANNRQTVALSILAMLVALALGMGAANRVVRPIMRLSATAKAIGAGDWTATAAVDRDDEVGELSCSFNVMTSRIRQLIGNLKEEVARRAMAETELTAALVRAQDEQEKTKAIIASVGDGISIQSLDYRVLYQNQMHKDFVGDHAGEFCYAGYEKRGSVCEGCPVASAFEDGTIHSAERVVPFPEGNRHFEITASPLRDSTGAIIAGIELVRDVTERARANEAIAAEKERLAVTLRSIGDAVIVTDMSGNVTLVNRLAETITGWNAGEAVGRPLADIFTIVDKRTREALENPVQEVFRSGHLVTLRDQTALVRRDGSEILIEDSVAPIRDAKSRIIGMVLVFRDITDKKRMEEELLKSKKLESLGILAGGLAHDFNNLLTAIMGNISIAKIHLPPEHQIYSRLEDAENAALRATDLTRRLLTFSKGGAPIKKTASIAAIIRETVGFTLSGANVRAEFVLPETCWPVDVDSDQMSQVFTNLTVNAIQALPNGGILAVRTENVTLGEQEVAQLPAGEYVKITVSDNGGGIPEDFLPKIFDPFFTTKPRGSGLGLSTVYSVVTRHEGHVLVTSRQGEGTAFHIYLRASRGGALAPAGAAGGLVRGRGRVLVMDDEEFIRDIAGRILRELGYEVECANDGAEAIEKYRAARDAGKPVDVVLMDLTIPGGLGGKEAIGKLRELDPNVRAIVSSGYSNDPVMADYQAYGFQGVIAKPYTIATMSTVLRALLEKPQRPEHPV